jgi:hypothetical protein
MNDPASQQDLTSLWQEFKASVPTRLMLPLNEFSYTLQYVPVHLEPEQRRHAVNIVTNIVVSALSTEPECALTNLSVLPASAREPTADESYFTLNFANPVYDFGIQMGPQAFTMVKRATTLQDLLLTSRLFAAIAEQLFPVQPETVNDGDPMVPPFAAAGIRLQPFRISFSWIHHLVLGTRLGTELEATNSELLTKLLRLGNDSGSSVEPLSSLSSGAIRRGDVNLGFTKELAGRPRQLWYSYEGPWNVTGKDVNVATTYRVGEADCPMEAADLLDFRTPFIEFFRNEVLNGFFADLFESANVEARLA